VIVARLRHNGQLNTMLIAMLLLAAGCGGAQSAARVVRVGYAGETDFSDLPSLVAHARLRARGVQVQPTFFSGPDVAVSALSNGTVDVMHGSMIGVWRAIGRGAPLRTVMQHAANPYRLIAVAGITDCAELNGRHLALPSESAVSTQLVRAFLKEECPDVATVEFLLPESSSRAAAFLAGGVDAGGLELSSWLWLQRQAPGRFAVLSDFAARWPNIRTTGVHVNTTFAQTHDRLVSEYLAAVMTANRDAIADAQLLVAAAREQMGRSEDWDAAARVYVDARSWPARGGLSRADVDETLRFFQTHSRLDPQLTADAVADLHYLERALADSHE
jgi:ABC-type nitrate/sulfonate/bicarbonate transport system substrate-binding protein